MLNSDEEEEEIQQNQKNKKEKTNEFLSNELDLNELKEEEINKLTKDEETDYNEERTCSMKEGSIQGSVFTLSSMALGTGAFSLPIRCTQLGCLWYSVAIIFGAIAAYWTLSKLHYLLFNF